MDSNNANEGVSNTIDNIIINNSIQIVSHDKINVGESDEPFKEAVSNLETRVQNLQTMKMFDQKNSISFSSAFKDQLLTCILLGTEAGHHLISLLEQQGGNLNVVQGQMYNKWYEIVLALATYKEVNDEGILNSIYNRLNSLMYLDNEPQTLEDLFQAFNKSTVSSVLEKWKFTPTTTFNDFIGRQQTVSKLKSYIDFRITKDSYQMILMGGPPGVGKSQFAQALMTYFKSTKNYILNMSELLSSHVGETEKALKDLFVELSLTDKSVGITVFFDEADEIFKTDVPSHVKSVAMVIQTCLQGSLKLGNNILILAATNYTTDIREPILDRVSAIIYVDVPERNDVEAFLRYSFKIPNANTPHLNTEVQTENNKYWNQVLFPLVRALPAATTYRNLNNLVDQSKIINLQKLEDTFMVIYLYYEEDATLSFIQCTKWDNTFYDLVAKNANDFKNEILYNINKPAGIRCHSRNHINILFEICPKNHVLRPDFEDFENASKRIQFLNKKQYDLFRSNNKEPPINRYEQDYMFMRR